MRATALAFLALPLLLALPRAAVGCEVKELPKVKSPEDVEALPAGTTAISMAYATFLWKGNSFPETLRAVEARPDITHLALYIGSTHREKVDPLHALRQLQSLKSISVDDRREGAPSGLFEHIAAMKGLEKVEFMFF